MTTKIKVFPIEDMTVPTVRYYAEYKDYSAYGATPAEALKKLDQAMKDAIRDGHRIV